jgi:Fic family protein
VATPIIHDREDPKRVPISQAIMHEIHALSFSGINRDRSRTTMQRDGRSPTDSHAYLYAIQSIESAHPLPIDELTFSRRMKNLAVALCRP